MSDFSPGYCWARSIVTKITGNIKTSDLFAVQQKGAERVKVAAVVAQETPGGQEDVHMVAGLQVEGHGHGGTVLLVLEVLLFGSGHQLAVDPQPGAGSQVVPRGAGVAVDGEGQAVDAGAGDREGTVQRVVAAAQVEEDVPVRNRCVGPHWAETLEGLVVEQGHREGHAVGWRQRGNGELNCKPHAP